MQSLQQFQENKKSLLNELAELQKKYRAVRTYAQSVSDQNSFKEINDEFTLIYPKLKKQLENEEFHIAFVGEFSTGKSSLLNVLFGENKKVLPEGSSATTAFLTFIRKAEKSDEQKMTITYMSLDEVIKQAGFYIDYLKKEDEKYFDDKFQKIPSEPQEGSDLDGLIKSQKVIVEENISLLSKYFPEEEGDIRPIDDKKIISNVKLFFEAVQEQLEQDIDSQMFGKTQEISIDEASNYIEEPEAGEKLDDVRKKEVLLIQKADIFISSKLTDTADKIVGSGLNQCF